MIICHTHKFIFIKTRKTAGTSIETALAKSCGDSDVITALSDEDEHARMEMGIRSAQHLKIPIRHYGKPELLRLFKGERSRFYNHFSAHDAKRVVPKQIWEEYFKFCVERDPFDRAISQYHWKTRKIADHRPPMSSLLQSLSDLNMSNWSLYTESDNVIVDHVIRYENLISELKEIGDRLGINIDISEIHAKSWTRTDRRQYWDVIDPDSRAIIEHRCAKEIAHFSYEWKLR